jgi:hypothetical protein
MNLITNNTACFQTNSPVHTVRNNMDLLLINDEFNSNIHFINYRISLLVIITR